MAVCSAHNFRHSINNATPETKHPLKTFHPEKLFCVSMQLFRSTFLLPQFLILHSVHYHCIAMRFIYAVVGRKSFFIIKKILLMFRRFFVSSDKTEERTKENQTTIKMNRFISDMPHFLYRTNRYLFHIIIVECLPKKRKSTRIISNI